MGGIGGVIRQGETGYVVMDNTPHRLAEKIALLLSMSNPKPQSSSSVRASVTRFSWSNIAEAISKQYRTVLRDYFTRTY